MNCYLSGDWHFGLRGDNPIWLKDYFDYFENVFIPYCKEHVKPEDVLIQLGDVFDNRSQVGIETLYRAVSLFEKFSEIFSKIIIIVGNHDIFQKHSNEITTINVLKHISNVEIIYQPEVRNMSGKDVLFVPWIEEKDEQKKLISSHNVDYVFGHLEIGGCVMSHKGNKLKSNNAVQSEDFKKAQVYAGHIHIRQDYKNVHYVGCPYHKDRGDIGNQKGFTILNIETGRTKFVPNTYSPEFKNYRIYDILDKTVGELKKEWNNNYVHLIIKSNDYPKCDFNKLREIFKNVYKGFEPETEKSDMVIDNVSINISESKSAPDMLSEYINQCDLNDEIKNGVLSKLKDFNI